MINPEKRETEEATLVLRKDASGCHAFFNEKAIYYRHFINKNGKIRKNALALLPEKIRNKLDAPKRLNVVIEKNITSISSGAFKNCNNLFSVEIRNGVTEIGKEAFSGCANLNKVVISGSVMTIGEKAFCDCHHLETVEVPSDARPDEKIKIGKNAFRGTALRSDLIWKGTLLFSVHRKGCVTISEKATKIGDELFKDCTDLTSVDLNNVSIIGDSAFTGCSNLRTIKHTDSIREIGDYAFEDCLKLCELGKDNMLPHAAEIGWFAFCGCKALPSIQLPEVQKICDGAFYRCTALKKVTAQPNEIGAYAFFDCVNLDRKGIAMPSDEKVGHGAFAVFQETPQPDIPGQIEASIDTMAREIPAHYSEWLDQKYKWRMKKGNEIPSSKFEIDTIKVFYEAGKGIAPNHFLEATSEDITNSVIGILMWGGKNEHDITESNEPQCFTEALIRIRNRQLQTLNPVDSSKNEDEQEDCSGNLSFLLEGQNERIAFWTKVLAAYKPGELFIYDSRVAIALSYISLCLDLPVFWDIPPEETTEDSYSAKAVRRFHRTINANRIRYHLPQLSKDRIGTPPRTRRNRPANNEEHHEGNVRLFCYARYIKLLKKLSNVLGPQYDSLDNKQHGQYRGGHFPFNIQIDSEQNLRGAYDYYFKEVGTENEKKDAEIRKKKAIRAHLEKMLFMMKEYILKEFDPDVFTR